MKKCILLLSFSLLTLSLCAQVQKKTRNTAENSTQKTTERQISSRFNSGLRSFYTAQYEDADRVFSAILCDNPKHAPSHYLKAKIYSAQQNYSEAENALKTAVKIDKNNIWYKVALAENHLKTENYKSAIPLWEEICRKMPNNEVYLFNLYKCYQKTGNTAKMIATLNSIENLLGPQDEITKKKIAIWIGQKNIDAAVKEYDYLIEKHPFIVSNYLKAGLLNEEHGRYDEALRYYETAYNIFPDDPEVNMMLANYFIIRNNEERAAKHIEKLLPDSKVSIDKKMPFIRKRISEANKNNAEQVGHWVAQLAKAHPNEAASYEAVGLYNLKIENFKAAAENLEKCLKIDDSNVELWSAFVAAVEKSGEMGRLTRFEEEITTIFPQSPDMLCFLGEAFLAQGNPDKAIEHFKQARAFAFDAQQIKRIDSGLHDAYTKKGDTDNAKRYSRQ